MHHRHRGEAKRDKGCSRRAHERDPGWLPVLGLLVGGVLGVLVACTPIRGYPGLERPKAEVALVTVASDHINRVLPGFPGSLAVCRTRCVLTASCHHPLIVAASSS
jgi:hypothetical protein